MMRGFRVCLLVAGFLVGACDPSDPPAPVCGNGVAEDGEDCDEQDHKEKNCIDLGFAPGGELNCSPLCRFETALCVTIPDAGPVDAGEDTDAGTGKAAATP